MPPVPEYPPAPHPAADAEVAPDPPKTPVPEYVPPVLADKPPVAFIVVPLKEESPPFDAGAPPAPTSTV